MFKTDAIILLGLALNLILIAVMALALRSLSDSVNALVREKAAVSPERTAVSPERAAVPMETIVVSPDRAAVPAERATEKPEGTGNVSPQLIAVISGAIAAYLDDEDLERHSISAIQLAEPQH